MSIILRNLAKVELPEEHRLKVLNLYHHKNIKDEVINNFIYKDGIAYLPLNITKLQYVAEILNETIVDERSIGEPLKEPFVINPEFKFRPHQTVPAHELLEFTKINKYSILKANCSCGKTVVNTWVCGNLQHKTLVLVDQQNLATQWQEAFKIVWNKEAQLLDKDATTFGDVVIATFQLLHRNPEMLKKMRDMFGCCVIDEFQINGADTYRTVLFKLNNQYRIGTSATIMRKGYSEEVLTDLIADVSVEMIDEQALIPEVRFLNTGISFFSNNPDNFTKTISKLAENEARNKMIADLTQQRLKENRKVLIVAARIECLKTLKGLLGANDASIALYVANTTHKQDKALRDGIADGSIRVVLTDKKAEKGLDLPNLDTVIIAKPMNNEATVTQIVGRILRRVEGKALPVVYDLVDRGDLSWRFAKNRYWWYKKRKYKFEDKVHFFLEKENKFC